jgi:AcrR family transcriptional regulator
MGKALRSKQSRPEERAVRDDKLALRLAQGWAIDDIANEAGIHPATVWRRRQKPELQAQIEQIQAIFRAAGTAVLVGAQKTLAAALVAYGEGKLDLTPDQLRTNLMLLGLAPNVQVGTLGQEASAEAQASAQQGQAQQVVVQVFENGARPDG